MRTYYTYNVDEHCYIVLSKNEGKITSVNMFVKKFEQLITYSGKLEKNNSGELKKNYELKNGDLLQSNTIPDDHDQIHIEAEKHAGVQANSTKDSRHWHWDVLDYSLTRNQTLVVYLHTLGLLGYSNVFGALVLK